MADALTVDDGANLWTIGQPVEARWLAQNAIRLRGATKWFSGRIASVPDAEGRCDVMYDDGDFEALVPGRFLRAPLAVPAWKQHSRQSRPSTKISTQASNSWAAAEAALAAALPSVPDPSSSPAPNRKRRPGAAQQQGTDQSPKDPYKRPRGPVHKGGTGGTGGAGGKGGKGSMGSSRQSDPAPVVDKLKAELARMKDLFDSGLLPENIYEAKIKMLLDLPLA